MTTSNGTLTAKKHKTITIVRTLNLPLETVWKAWTDHESFKKWWGPKEYTCSNSAIDFKVGGKYLNSMKAVDGTEIWSTGTYTEIVPQQKIVYTDSFADSEGNIVPSSYYKMPEMPMELVVTLTFEAMGDKTNMVMESTGVPAEIGDECIKGWQSSFDKLESNVK